MTDYGNYVHRAQLAHWWTLAMNLDHRKIANVTLDIFKPMRVALQMVNEEVAQATSIVRGVQLACTGMVGCRLGCFTRKLQCQFAEWLDNGYGFGAVSETIQKCEERSELEPDGRSHAL